MNKGTKVLIGLAIVFAIFYFMFNASPVYSDQHLNFGERIQVDENIFVQRYILDGSFDIRNTNFVVFPSDIQNFMAHDIVFLAESVNLIRYHIEVENKFIYYLSMFDGKGNNFDIVPGEVYELYTDDDIVLDIPLI